ncbi:hypothetical protein H9X85_06065 [Anaerotignum lactatifermentans]|uniref:Uncharacterized protein n=1 Tax=Anaerotignum lactatifermentans TaxID=160404 RepID=A0ABS2G7U6_9FIRM|nr:hypothetical protein [Anaerotignum lactatifermentans]MBM6829201.1 hypothetical protein [Anaerotignum lactatifermentans]MBM6877559.1 hypothetical protein [Anaerotignum lactatifermentans]MBM6950779.1 hypothetical protein [Anaerotignum lactatifermentans]
MKEGTVNKAPLLAGMALSMKSWGENSHGDFSKEGLFLAAVPKSFPKGKGSALGMKEEDPRALKKERCFCNGFGYDKEYV